MGMVRAKAQRQDGAAHGEETVYLSLGAHRGASSVVGRWVDP